MDKIVTENLFLLEFVIDNVHLDSSVVRGIGDAPCDTCVSVQFLDNPPFDICEDDFAPRRRYSQDSSNVKSGKSCLFSLTPTQANKALHQFDVYVTIFKKMQQRKESSEKVQVGTSLVSIVNLFSELIASVSMTANENGPTAKTLKDTFQIVNNVDQYVGNIVMYIRMSCFGKLIVTQFQMNLDDKSILFKDKEGSSLYRYKKAGQYNGAKGKTSSVSVCDIPSCPARAPSTSCPRYARGSPQVGSNSAVSSPQSCYQEIGASMGANALTIRVHKDKKLEPTDGDNDSCTCSNTYQTGRNDQSRRFSGGSYNQEQKVSMRPGYNYGGNTNTPFSVKLGGCGTNGQNNVTVMPPVCTTPDGTQFTEISDPDRDVFILRIGKKSEGPDRKDNVELELCTPRGPDVKPIPKKETRDTQWANEDVGGGSGKNGNGENFGNGGKDGNGGNGGNGANDFIGGKNGKGDKNISKSGETEGRKRSSESAKPDKKEYSPPDYGNPHIIGGNSEQCRPCKSFSPCSTRASSPSKHSSFCNCSAAWSYQSFGSCLPCKPSRDRCRMWY